MSRRHKGFDDRRAAIMDAAWELFSRHGYERTGVQAVIDALGISKGTFYHYFASKEALFEALVERFCVEVVDATIAAVTRPGQTALARLQALIEVPREWKMRHLAMSATVGVAAYREEYRTYMAAIVASVNQQLAPILTDVIRQGVSEGVFSARDPETAADLFLAFLKTLGDLLGPELVSAHGDQSRLRRIEQRAAEGFRVLESILGADAGTLGRVDSELYERVDRAVTAHARPDAGPSSRE